MIARRTDPSGLDILRSAETGRIGPPAEAGPGEVEVWWCGTVEFGDALEPVMGRYARRSGGGADVRVIAGPPGASASLDGADLVLRIPLAPTGDIGLMTSG